MIMPKTTTDILFIIPPYHKRNGSGSMFPLGLSSIIACLDQKNLTYEYIDCTQIIDTLYEEDLRFLEETLNKELVKIKPSLVGIGPCVTPGARAIETISECCINIYGKEIVFAGGPFTTLPSQEWFFYDRLGLDYLIKGDGEEAICNAIEIVKEGKPLLACRHVSSRGNSIINIINNLDELPFPKRINLENSVISERRRLDNKGKTAHIVASRGCPYSCDYCVSGNLRTIFKKRSVDSIVAEMKYLYRCYGVTDIIFYDDCFFSSSRQVHKEIRDFCNALINNHICMTWQIEIRPDILMNITDNELLLLAQSGCRQMNIGIEKTYHDGAAVLGKKYDYERLRTFLSHIHDICDIQLSGTFILGGKGETEESVRSLIRNSANMNLDKVEYSPLFVYPDTPIYSDMFKNHKEWFDVILNSNESWGEVVYENDELCKEQLLELIDEAYTFFYGGTRHKQSKRVRDRYNLRGLNSEPNI